MKISLKLTVMVVAVLLVVTPVLAITYGWIDGNRHPNVGVFAIRVQGQLQQMCSGTLVSPTVFLTAGHCTAYVENVLGITRAEVTFDSSFSENGSFYAGTIHSPPGYTSIRGPDPVDVGVIVLDAPIVGITPAALPPVGLLDQLFRQDKLKNREFTAVGYGMTAHFRLGPPELQPNVDRRYAISEFVALTDGWLHVSENPATGSGGTCYGDSGGPTFLGAGASETPYVVATTSKGDAMCRSNDTRYRIDTPGAHEFLAQYVTVP